MRHSRRRFADGARPGTCVVDFSIALRVSSPLHAHALGVFFSEVAERQIAAFEARCRHVYGAAAHGDNRTA
jgi:coenzyme Q-binding protein COQ10